MPEMARPDLCGGLPVMVSLPRSWPLSRNCRPSVRLISQAHDPVISDAVLITAT